MIIDRLQNSKKYSGLGDRIASALAYLEKTDFTSMPPGRYEIDGDKLVAMVNEYETKHTSEEKLEAHKKHIDVQYMVTGSELMGYSALTNQRPSVEYNEEKDLMFFDESPAFFLKVDQGMFTIFFPTDMHMPATHDQSPSKVKKVIMKVKVCGMRYEV